MVVSRVTVVDHLDALMSPADDRCFRVGVVLPTSGVLGLAGPSALDAVTLAGQELNESRSSSDRRVELVLVDSGGAAAEVARRVGDLAAARSVSAFVALHTSDTMDAVHRALRGTLVPYVFTPGHESSERLGVYCSGESPDDLADGLARVVRDRAVREWALVGTDYVWPQAVGAAAVRAIEREGGRVVLQRVIPAAAVERGIPAVIEALAASSAGGVVINIPGRGLAAMLEAVRVRGLDDRLVRFSGALEENVLYAIGGDSSGNLYSAAHSFESLQSSRRLELNDRHRHAFGSESPVLNSWAEHCYDGVNLVTRLEREGLLHLAGFGAGDADLPAAALAARPRYRVHLGLASGMSFVVV